MTQAIATAVRLATMPALALLFGLSAAPPGAAQDTPSDAVEATDTGTTGEGFVPPMFGAPTKRVGAGSRELGPTASPCPETETATAGAATTPADCAEAGAAASESEGESDAGAGGAQ